MKRNCALFQGRFQPPTIAHLCTVQTILQKWTRLIIGIVHNTPKPDWFDPRWDEYLLRSEATSYAPGKNPFTPHEVKEMWTACIATCGLDQYILCDIIKRPYFDKDFSRKYPPLQIDLVRPEQHKEDTHIDLFRGTIFPELLDRQIWHACPPFKLHNTQIKKIVQAGLGSWDNFIPSGAYDVFIRIDGPARIEAASKLDT